MKHNTKQPCKRCLEEGKLPLNRVFEYNLEINRLLREKLDADKWEWEDYQIEFMRGN